MDELKKPLLPQAEPSSTTSNNQQTVCPSCRRTASSQLLNTAASPRPRPGSSFAKMLLALFAFYICWALLPSWASTPSDPVEAVLKEVPLIDTHIDFPIFLRAFYKNHIYDLSDIDILPGQVDFPRLRHGRLGAAFWSVWVPCPPDDDGGDYDDDDRYTEAVAMTYSQIDLVHRLIRRFPDQLTYTPTSSAVFHNHQYEPPFDTIGSLIGGEGLHSIGNSVSNLRMFYELGMRYMTLTHNCHNIYADAAISKLPPRHGGLSDKGVQLVLEMNRMGMMVDLSHVSAQTMRDVLVTVEAPVIFSHSGAYGVSAHPRNVPDDVLAMLPANGGVVQVDFLPEFVNSQDPESADLGMVADHIEYIGKRIGYEHVGIGSDFDGMLKSVKGLEDVSHYPALLRELWQRGLSYRELAGVAGLNLLRVLREVEAVAAKSTRLPLEDDVHFGFNGSSVAETAISTTAAV